ncbi:MAG: hypothetical protein WC340_07295 [Kiritimatiellia bacterium]
MKKLCGLAIIAVWMCSAGVREPAALEQKNKGLELDLGGDFRLRQELIYNLPAGNVILPDQNFFRFRSRLWGEAKHENFRLYTRLANEMYDVARPHNSRKYKAPDEVVVDNLYLDANDLLGGWLDLRLGRQDLMYGAGRVLMDGTPFDGSRTIYMDAIKATINFDREKKNTLDLLAIYNRPDNELSVGGLEGQSDRQLNSINPRSRNLAEYGGGLYFKSKELDELPFDIYWIYKRETKADLNGAKLPGRKFHTWGLRLMPKYTETISGEYEGAVQAGEQDGGTATRGYMGFAALKYAPVVEWTIRPFVKGGVYYLSGDKQRGAGHADSAWDPVWARWPQFSELYVYNFKDGAGYWTNLIYPHLEAGCDITKAHKLGATVGPMYADEKDGLGGGSGDLYGWLGSIFYEFPILTNVFGRDDQRGNVIGRVQAEVLDPGDYYTTDKVAYYLRWQIIASF